MNKRLNAYCTVVLVMIGLTIGYTLYSTGKIFGMGVAHGWNMRMAEDKANKDIAYAKSKEYKDLMERDKYIDLRTQTVNMKFGLDIDASPVKVKNERTGKEEKVWITSCDVPYKVSDSLSYVSFIVRLIYLLLLIIAIVTTVNYYKLIRNFSKSDNIFSLVNLKYIKRIAILTTAIYLMIWTSMLFDLYICNQSFALEGRTIDYISMLELPNGLFEIPFLFIIYEVFSIGVKMREENQLTV